jgi:hypothetical protein
MASFPTTPNGFPLLYNLQEDRAGRWSAPRRHIKRGGEGGHGAATPDVATHRYLDSLFYNQMTYISTPCRKFLIPKGPPGRTEG